MKTEVSTFCAAMLLLLLPVAVQAEDFTYTTNSPDTNTITITGYNGTNLAVTIPNTISNLTVTRIGDYAFQDREDLTSVSIPNSVTSIGEAAFLACTNLTSVTIPDSVTYIGDLAFYACTSLTNLVIGNSVTYIGGGQCGAFGDCTSLTSVIIPASVNYLGECAFVGCASLTNVLISNGVTDIGDCVFYGCPLTNVTIPNSVTTIGDEAFARCASLTNVIIGNGVTGTMYGTFWNCTNLTSVFFTGSTPVEVEAFSGDTNVTIYYLPGATGWSTNFDGLPTAVWNIFSYTTNSPDTNTITITGFNQSPPPVSAVTIPNTINGLTVTSIGVFAFHNCTSLTSVTIGNSVTNIGGDAFSCCTGLTTVTIPDSVTHIGGMTAFGGCMSLTNVTIGNGVTCIGECTFYFCTKLTTVIIGNGVTNMGAPFPSCFGLTSVYFEGNAPGTDPYVFADSTNVTIYYLPGTTGWSTNFDGQPTALWRPRVSGDGNFGVRTNQFGFDINWASGMVFVVEACTNLANPVWSPLQTNTLAGDSCYFSDPNSTNCQRRFYRMRWQ